MRQYMFDLAVVPSGHRIAMNNTMNTTAGLFIEESDDDQDDDLKRDDNYNNNRNGNHNANIDADILHSQSSMGSLDLGVSQSQPHHNGHGHGHNDLDDDDFDDDDDVELSLKEQVIYLTTAWRNEKLSPEILQYEDDMVEAVKEAIDEREAQIEDAEEEIAAKLKNSGGSKIECASQHWYRKEVERIRFILHSYLRVRIWKVQRYTLYFLSDEESWNRLSEAEQQLAAAYSSLGERHFKDCFLRDLPKKYQSIDDREMLVIPDLRKFVVFQANEDRDNVMIEGGKHHVNLQKGNIFVASYTNFKHLVYDGVVDLI